MSLHQVSTQAVSHPECPLQIYPLAVRVVSELGASQRGSYDVDFESSMGQALYR
jgi:hypothetical protein